MTTDIPLQVTRVGLLMLLFATSAAEALDPSRRLTQLGHTAWRVRDGSFSGAPYAIAQTKDGYIWVGTQAGLLRFDGIRFVPWDEPRGGKLPSNTITALLGARDGSVWIGTQAGVAHWKDGLLTSFPSERGPVTSFYEDTSGVLWFTQTVVKGSTGALCQIAGTATRCYPTAKGGVPHVYARSIVGDERGALWSGTNMSVVRWQAGAVEEFVPGKIALGGVMALESAPDGTLWVGMPSGPNMGLQQLVNGKFRPHRTAQFDSSTLTVQALYLDDAQVLWVGTNDEGLYRIRGDTIDRFRTEDGLSSNLVRQLMKDHEGTVWVVTADGIDSFRDLPVANFTRREGMPMTEIDTVVAGRDGSVWIGGYGTLAAIRAGQVNSIGPAAGLPGHQVTSILEDRSGALWVGVEYGLTVYRDKRFHPILTREGKPTGLIVGLAEDTDGSIWAEASGFPRKLLRIRGERVIEEYLAPEMPEARRIATDPAGGIWLGLRNGNIARFRAGKLDTFTFRSNESANFETQIDQIEVAADGSVLAASPQGLIGWKAGIQRTLSTANGLPCDAVLGFVLDLRGNLWLYTQCGYAEIARDQVDAWWRSPHARVRPRVFDGVDGARPGSAPFVAAARSTDGRLWFVNGAALQMIDPARVARNPVPPPVHIEALVADRKTYSPIDALRLPARTRDIEIDYTGLSFIAPTKMRFRYRLEGHDMQWQEPGTRRQALYNDLAPGAYTFRVIASNNDGLWNASGAKLSFSVLPAWYQTTAFRILMVVFTVLGLWLIHRIRMWQVAKALGDRFNERLTERTRIARELHDTLLQTIQASKLVADSSLASSADPSLMRRNLEKLSSFLAIAVHEGRVALNSLRASTMQRNDLADSLRLAAQQDAPPAMDVVLNVTGDVREMHPVVRDEINRIGCEAIRNACRHSEASRLEIHLFYGSDLELRVNDNGKGIASGIVEHGAIDHYGIQGMRERAASIGGSLSFSSAADKGTVIELIVPGHVIYDRKLHMK